MNTLTLYEMTAEYREALSVLAESDLDEQTVADTLEGLQGEIEVKAKNVAMFARELEATAEAIQEAEKRMAARRKAIESRAAGLRRYLLTSMQACEIHRIDSPWFTLSRKKNPPKVVIDNKDAIPAEFMRFPEPPPPEPDKKLIAEVLKDGGTITGAHLEHSERLDIR